MWLTAIFFVIALVLATLIGHGYRGKDELSAISAEVHKAGAAEAVADTAAKTAEPAAKK